ncbi:DUF7697 family protein [Sphingobium sp. RAC03]|uniref:DUF7697 family protein n=1 Tax=Sphingobium sp. RAC03 TaxID=1843368 RepID=UPI00149546A5|nr:hypothetical protein [Sphingobium sp. RAC03]
MRAGFGRPFALDFGAVLAVGQAQRVDMALLADLLAPVERILLDQMTEEKDDGTS